MTFTYCWESFWSKVRRDFNRTQHYIETRYWPIKMVNSGVFCLVEHAVNLVSHGSIQIIESSLLLHCNGLNNKNLVAIPKMVA